MPTCDASLDGPSKRTSMKMQLLGLSICCSRMDATDHVGVEVGRKATVDCTYKYSDHGTVPHSDFMHVYPALIKQRKVCVDVECVHTRVRNKTKKCVRET